jgi:anti-sigma factor RsiW
MSDRRAGDSVDHCRELEPVLSAYVDQEAAEHDCSRVRRHIEHCGVCRDRVAGEQAARDAVRSRKHTLRACAPDGLKSRCAAHARRPVVTPTLPQASFVRRWAPLSLAATVLLAVAAVFGLGLNDKVQALAFQTTLDHVSCSRFKSAQASIDPVSAAQSWQARFGWAIAVPSSSETAHLKLEAVRRCALLDGRLAHLVYSWMGEPLSVFVLPRRTLGDETEFARRLGHNSIMWSQNDRTYIIVTPRPRDPSLDQVIAYVRARAY